MTIVEGNRERERERERESSKSCDENMRQLIHRFFKLRRSFCF
jgi:hypothetical protein